MIGRPLSTLLSAAGLPVPALPSDPLIRTVVLDSRRAVPGSLFVAIRGEREDGTAFARDAVARGSVAVVAETPPPPGSADVPWLLVENARRAAGLLARESFGRPDASMALVGITGTNGKTTTACLLESIVSAAGRSAGRIGTVGYAFAGRSAPAERTTPEGPDLFALLAAMRDAGVDVVAMEVSSHALALERVAGVRFRAAVFLNLGRDHLDFHRTLDAYFESKASLFETLSAEAWAILPTDDPHGKALATRTRGRVLTFGRAEEADVRVEEEVSGPRGSRARLRTPGGTIEVETALLGRFNLLNLAAAAASAVALGLDAEAIRMGAAALPRVPGRLEPVDCGQPFAVLVDYAHTEQALAAMLAAVREIVPGRVAVVFGCGGDRDRGKREGMGRAGAEGADLVVLTSDNPRGEDPLEILREVERGARAVSGDPDRVAIEPDRRAAVARALAWARPGDAVVVAGKGHETTQSAGGREERLDDREVAREALATLGWAA